MKHAEWCPYRLDFTFNAVTSRQSMTYKDTYFIRVTDDARPNEITYAECALFKGLSAEDCADYEKQLSKACASPEDALRHPFSSIRFGFEQALSPSPVSSWSAGKSGIPINGLVWMGDKATMRRRIAEKLDAGFGVLKLKIGGISFDDELDLLDSVRRTFSSDALEIRLDANGHFSAAEASGVLARLAPYHIHSIEQPIAAGQPEAMGCLCRHTPIPIALDEELIGLRSAAEARMLIEEIKPQYIILKPSFCGGYRASDDYIAIAGDMGIGWWATSALESNVGLYGLGAWLAHKGMDMPQGLGTGQLYSNNIASPLELRGSALWCGPGLSWGDMEGLPWRS